jgi:hypothetical protein
MVQPKHKPALAQALTDEERDFAFLDQRFDDGIANHLEVIAPNDSIETMLADSMFLRMI